MLKIYLNDNFCWSTINFFDYNSYLIMLMIEFNDISIMILLLVLLFIIYILFWFLINKFVNKNILHNQLLEVVWTIIPVLILIFIVIPSLKILYRLEEIVNPILIIKIVGHQWYWRYEYSDFLFIEFDSFIINLIEDKIIIRLLDVDNRLILPNNLGIRALITSLDVIHSWAIPRLGIKVDAIPGRINQCLFILRRLGLYFGQCSEICGLNHSFIPIVLEVINLKYFFKWLENFLLKIFK